MAVTVYAVVGFQINARLRLLLLKMEWG